MRHDNYVHNSSNVYLVAAAVFNAGAVRHIRLRLQKSHSLVVLLHRQRPQVGYLVLREFASGATESSTAVTLLVVDSLVVEPVKLIHRVLDLVPNIADLAFLFCV